MNAIKLIKRRRSVRKFKAESVDHETLREIVELAPGVCVLSHVRGKCGRLDPEKFDRECSNPEAWESFDAGLASQTFCLAAHAKGVGTTILDVIDKETIPKLLNLPDDETVSALIVYGRPDEIPETTPRLETEQILHVA